MLELCEVSGLPFAMVKLWSLDSFDAGIGAAEWQLQDHIEWVALDDILDTVVWMPVGDGFARTLIPWYLHNV